MTTEQEYDAWKHDPKAQEEYAKWKIEDELKRNQLPDPFNTNTSQFAKAFNEIFGVKNELSS